MKLKIIIAMILIISSFSANSTIVINEVVTENNISYTNIFGLSNDWIELFNNGNDTINLQNWILTDEEYNYKWKFPEILIPPDSFLIICCSDYNIYYNGELHTNFKLDNDRETIFLYNQSLELIDKLEIPKLYIDYSYGRYPDGSNELTKFIQSSPGRSNNYSIKLIDLIFSHPPGFYDNQFYLTLMTNSPGTKIYYTLDGSEPDTNSFEYNSPIFIRDKTNEPNYFSMIKTNPEDAPIEYRWKEPKKEIFKANTIRAVAYKNGIKVSPIYTNTFFIFKNHRKFTFPVISITTNSSNLFDYEKGIYVPGKFYDTDTNKNWYWGNGNYHQDGDEWERQAHIEFFEVNGQLAFSQDIGIRIYGTGSRALPEKSLCIYARKEYGNELIKYKIFPNNHKTEFKRLILRNSGQDFLRTMFADALIQTLSKNTGIEYQDFIPAIVFINGEYWGIHNIREKYDEYYFQELTGVDLSYISLYDSKLLSNPYLDKHFYEMYNFMLNNDLSDDQNYDKISEYIDIFNTVNSLSQKIFFGIYDWPGNNVKLWRTNTHGSKWRWLSFDNDDGLLYPDINFFLHCFNKNSNDWRNPPWATFIFCKLAENEKFRTLLINTFKLRLQTVFSVENVLNKIDEFKNTYEPEMPEHIDRWVYPDNIEVWHGEISRMKNYVISRENKWDSDIQEFLQYTYIDNSYPENNLNIFPNPTDGIINIFYNEFIEKIKLYDYIGQPINKIEIKNFGYSALLNINNCNDGLYFLEIKTKSKIVFKKIIKY